MLFLSFGILLVGYFLLVAVHFIPHRSIDKNLRITSEIFMKEGDYPTVFLNGAFLENFSDADAFAIIYNKKDSVNPFINALYAYNYSFPDEHHRVGRGVEAFQNTITLNLKKSRDYNHTQEWHGFQIYLRPLLMRYNLPDIRLFGYITNFILLIIVCLNLAKARNDLFAFLPCFIGYEFFHYSLESMSILLHTDICVMLIGCLAIILLKDQFIFAAFLVIGLLAAFFSMFNMPMITVGFPLIVWLMLHETVDSWIRIKKVIEYSFFWLLGYSIATFSKVFIAACIFKKNVKHILGWYVGINDNVSHMKRIEVLKNIIVDIFTRSLLARDLLILITVSALIYIICSKKYRIIDWRKCIPYLIVALYPCIWVYIVVVHSKLDWTVFIFGISIFAFMQMLYDLSKRASKKLR